jgi:hypothetical protein
MKKRTKITLRTKIYLTIVGLLAMAGIIYAVVPPGTPVIFSTFSQLTGVAATKTELFATGFQNPNPDIYTLDCSGIPTLYQAAQGGEKYIAIAPRQSAAAGFTPRDVFITFGQFILSATPPGPFTLFTTIPCSETDHTGITFDKVGTFGNDMIVTCKSGDVFKIDNLPVPPNPPHITFLAHAASPGGEIEGPAVAPSPGFGPFSGQILVADEGNSEINAIKNDGPPGTVTHNIFNFGGGVGITPEGVTFVQEECTYCGFAFFQSSQQSPPGFPSMFAYPPTDFTGLAGSALVPLEQGQQILLVQFLGGNYVTSVFDNPPGSNVLEGFSFVDCDVPTPTPTPTPSATFTPTATATATATATPTPTPTPTVTPTTCGNAFVIGDLDAVVGNKVTFWGAQWWKKNHLSGGTAPASFKGFANCTNPNPPACGGTWISDPGNSSHPPDTVPADITVIVSSLITKSGQIESGDIPKMVTIHTNPGYDGNPGHEGTGTVTAVVCP